MSTQRRENHPTPATKINRRGPRNRRQRRSCTGSAMVSGHAIPAPIALYLRAFAAVGSAPRPNWMATCSLKSDHSYLDFVTPAWFVKQDMRRGSPPPGAGLRAASGTITTRRSLLPFIPSPPGFAYFHPAWPEFPALNSCWTERYDGKRDLHFQHAA